MGAATFPEQRFVEAGANATELDTLRKLFETSDFGLQGALAAQWAALSSGGLVDYLATMRADNFFPTVDQSTQGADTFDAKAPLATTAPVVDETTSESENDHEGAEAADTPSD